MIDVSKWKWTVARVVPGTEADTAYRVLEIGKLPAFTPTRGRQVRVSRHSKRTREVRDVVYPGYVFVGWPVGHTRTWEQLREAVPSIRGVLRYKTRILGVMADAIVAPQVVDLLLRDEPQTAKPEAPTVQVGQEIKPTSGPFAGVTFVVSDILSGGELRLITHDFAGEEREIRAEAEAFGQAL